MKGSHRWGEGAKPTEFHAPDDHRAAVKAAAEKLGKRVEIVAAEVPAGGASFHHAWLWHGSGPNRSRDHRRVLAMHCMPKEAAFHPTNPAYAQGRYRKFGETVMEESFYPILWSTDGHRSRFIDAYLAGEGRDYRSHSWRAHED